MVPHREVAIAHVIANPRPIVFEAINMPFHKVESIGIIRITPSEATGIASDAALDAAQVNVEFIDRFMGTLLLTGRLKDVETAIKEVMHTLSTSLDFKVPDKITFS
jgi:ethanolamine utilization protein EutS